MTTSTPPTIAQKSISQKKQFGAREAVLSIFHELMREKGYGKITVQDILQRAQIGRTTFYTHFSSKEDVLNGSIDHLRDGLIAAVKSQALKMDESYKAPIKKPTLKFTFYFFNHILSHHKLYDDIVGGDDFFIVER